MARNISKEGELYYAVESLFEFAFSTICKNLDKCLDWDVIMTLPSHIKQRLLKYLAERGKIDDENISYLIDKYTTTIQLSRCRVTSTGLQKLTNCPNLEQLILGSSSRETADIRRGLRVLFSQCKNLRYVDLRGFTQTDDETISILARNCPHLQVLDISGSTYVSDFALEVLAECCTSLKILGVNNTEVTDAGVLKIANSLCAKELTEFRSSFSKKVTGRAIEELLRKCPKLSVLAYHCSDGNFKIGALLNLGSQLGVTQEVTGTIDFRNR